VRLLVIKVILARIIIIKYIIKLTFYKYLSILSFIIILIYNKRLLLFINIFKVLSSSPLCLYYLYTLVI
jgi:hypothetical protein